ncbi:hypothetical protein AA16663_1577 [Komagataeibacter rhaeticus DSM 16663]|nr:hypothetical protein AA16663_1577 [Komagataeibacter rhaeticus DSM 16663]SAY47211.1 hypothetical protein KRIGEM_00139 [Komagataeibacter rhaeticus]
MGTFGGSASDGMERDGTAARTPCGLKRCDPGPDISAMAWQRVDGAPRGA